jgi:hypothetical protein
MRLSMRRSLLLLIPLAGCAAATDPSGGEGELVRELAGRIAGEPQRCISLMPQQGLTIEDRRTVVHRGGNVIWVNRLERDCPGFGPMKTLIVEAHGSQYCRGDRVRAMEPGLGIPGPVCPLADFVPYRRPE